MDEYPYTNPQFSEMAQSDWSAMNDTNKGQDNICQASHFSFSPSLSPAMANTDEVKKMS